MAFLVDDPMVGKPAPDFTLPASIGADITLSNLKGKKVALYFYPKDNTPGCTQQACDLEANLAALEEKNIVVLGISKDNIQSHKKFAEKFKLTFPLLFDSEGSVCNTYGVWVEKSMYGKKYFGIERSTFIIDESGKISHIWRKVNVNKHTQEILNIV